MQPIATDATRSVVVVCPCVCLCVMVTVTTVSLAKMSAQIEMPVGTLTCMGPRNLHASRMGSFGVGTCFLAC